MVAVVTAPAWHDEARRLVEIGVSKSLTARKLGVDRKQVEKLFNPAYAERCKLYQKRRRAERLATDPGYREKCRAWVKRSRIRKAARDEAAETGVPVEQVYERWGVA